MLSVQPGFRGSNDLRVGRKMQTFKLLLQSGRAEDLSAPLYNIVFHLSNPRPRQVYRTESSHPLGYPYSYRSEGNGKTDATHVKLSLRKYPDTEHKRNPAPAANRTAVSQSTSSHFPELFGSCVSYSHVIFKWKYMYWVWRPRDHALWYISYNKINSMHRFLKFIFGMKLYVFRTVSFHHQEFFTLHIAMVYVSKHVWHTPLLCVLWKTPDVVQRNCPKHIEFYSKSKFEKLVHLVGII